MTKFNPYEVLGVKTNAPEGDIKRCYRTAANRTHPDKGGKPGEFEAVQRAYDLLMDPERRKRFDATGDADDVKPDQTLAAAMQVITDYFQTVIKQAVVAGQDATQIDLIANARTQINNQLEHHLAGKAKAENHIAQLEKVGKRLKRKKPDGDDVIQASLKWQAEQIQLQIVPVEANIRALRDALDILKDYGFDVTPAQATRFVQMTSGTSW